MKGSNMRTKKLLLVSIASLMIFPSVLLAETIVEWNNITVRGGHKDKKIMRLNPGKYNFTLKIKTKARRPKVKFKISQKNAVLGRKQLFKSTYKKGTKKGQFIVQARRLRSASGSASGEYHQNEQGTGASGAGAFEADMANVDATRKIIFIVKNPIGKKKIKYSLKITKE
jgi:hypothetical protein